MSFLNAIKNIFKSDEDQTPSVPTPSQTPEAIQAAAVAWATAQSVINAEETQQNIFNPKAYIREKIAEAKNTFQEFKNDPFWEIVDTWKKAVSKFSELVDSTLPWTPFQNAGSAISNFWSFINEKTKPLQDQAYTYLNDFADDLRAPMDSSWKPKNDLFPKFAWDFIYNNLRPLGAERSTTFQNEIADRVEEWKLPWYKDAWYTVAWFLAPVVADIPTSVVRSVTKYDERWEDQLAYAGTALEAWLNFLPTGKLIKWVLWKMWLIADDLIKPAANELVWETFTVWKKKFLDHVWELIDKVPSYISDPISIVSRSLSNKTTAWRIWDGLDVLNKHWTNIWSSRYTETRKIAPEFRPDSIDDMLQLNNEYKIADPKTKQVI